MKTILDQFFNSDECWNKFKLFQESTCYADSSLFKYKHTIRDKTIILDFYEFQGVKQVRVYINKKKIIDTMLFLNLEELLLILNRVFEVRYLNRLSKGPLSIRAFFGWQKKPN